MRNKNKKFPFLFLLFVWYLPLLLISANPIVVEKEIVKKVHIVYIEELTPCSFNNRIASNISYYENVFAEKEKISNKIAGAILHTALNYDVPITLAFALAFTESSYRTRAFNYSNSNKSFDYGLFQLNSFTFPFNEEKMEIWNNTNLALKYLKSEYDKLGSWELALIAYNAGFVFRYNTGTREYVKRILEKQAEINEWFKEYERDKILRSFSES